MNGGDERGIPGEPLWGPPQDKPYDWAKERGYPKFPRSWDWEEVVAIVLAIAAVAIGFWLLSAIT